MAALNTVSYRYGRSNLDAAAVAEVVVLDGGAVRTLQVLVPNGTLRPIDPDDSTTIPLDAIRGPANETVTEYPQTDAIGEWLFSLVGYPTCHLGVTGPEAGAVEKIYQNVTSAEAVAQMVVKGVSGSSTFDGTVDWYTQVDPKPPIPTTAADVGAIPTSARGEADGVAPLTGLLVPFSFLPVGTTSTTVSRGDHTHAGSYDILPAGVAVTVYETSAGVWPARPTTRTDIPMQWVGQIQPTVAQGWRDRDHWINVVVVS
jgi:hypothetical protein